MKRKNQQSRSFKRDRWAWGVFLTLSIGGGGATWAWYHRRVLPPSAPLPAVPAAVPAPKAFRLAVLEYGRIQPEQDGRELEAARLEAHLALLRARGFTPVTAAMVDAAYRDGAPLPDRPVLLTFDGGYLSTYEAVHPLLARLRWPALMLLETGAQERRDPVFLFWDRLQIMVDSGVWEIGTHGHRAADPKTHAAPATGEASFERSRALIESNLRNAHVIAYAPMMGRTPALASVAAPAAAGPRLAFRTDVFGVDGPEDKPLALNRLKVDLAWSPEELVRRLEWAVTDPRGAETAADLERWIPDQPGFKRTPAGLQLGGQRRNDIWLSGSRWLGDWVLETRIRVDSGEFWFMQEQGYGDRHWRFGGKQQTLYFQDRNPGAPPVTIARLDQGKPVTGWHDVRLVRRGSGLWAEVDGKPVSELPFPLPGPWHGNLGIVSAPDNGPGHLEVASAHLRPLPYVTLPASADPSADEIQRLSKGAAESAAVSPRWATRGQGRVEEANLNQDLFRMLQRRYAWEVLPEVKLLDRDDPASAGWVPELARKAAAAGWNGLRLDLGQLAPADQAAWRAAAARLAAQLKTEGLRLVVAPEAPLEGEAR